MQPQAMVQVWQTDPAPGHLAARPLPDAARTPLAFRLDHRKPRRLLNPPHTPEFRYWVAAEALRRTADFWAPCVPGGRWHPGRVLKVTLNAGRSFNALYDRSGLQFYHGPAPPGTAPHGTIYAGESPDIVCHEMGHAVLDVLKPEIFHADGPEFAAFHESFGDVTAMLSALQVPELRLAVLAETGGDLTRNSSLSRLGEQLGAAIRARAPDAVDPDCLRNAANRFVYRPPAELPANAPAHILSAEPHSLSRVFTGAMLDALAALFARRGTADETALLATSRELRDLLAEAVGAARVIEGFFVEVADQLVRAAARRELELEEVFQARGLRRAVTADMARPPAVLTRGEGQTHRFVAEDGRMVLRRCHFDCGLVHW